MTNKSTKIISYAFLIVVSLLSIFPLVWMIIAATNKSVDVVAGKLTFGGQLLENYRNLMASQDVWRFFWNSAKYAVITTI